MSEKTTDQILEEALKKQATTPETIDTPAAPASAPEPESKPAPPTTFVKHNPDKTKRIPGKFGS